MGLFHLRGIAKHEIGWEVFEINHVHAGFQQVPSSHSSLFSTRVFIYIAQLRHRLSMLLVSNRLTVLYGHELLTIGCISRANSWDGSLRWATPLSSRSNSNGTFFFPSLSPQSISILRIRA